LTAWRIELALAVTKEETFGTAAAVDWRPEAKARK
jgi:hypothetical protein